MKTMTSRHTQTCPHVLQKNIIAIPVLQYNIAIIPPRSRRQNETIPHTHKSCARGPLRHTQLNSPRYAECVQCDFAAKSPPIRILTLLVVAIASRRAHWPTTHLHRSDKTETIPHTHTHTSCARRPLRHTQLNSPRHAECVQCDFAAQSPPIRFSTLLVVSAQHRGSGCIRMAAWRCANIRGTSGDNTFFSLLRRLLV